MKLYLDSLSLKYPCKLNPSVPQSSSKASSVVVPLYSDTNGNFSVILTKRNENLKNHPGQISFPGGVKGQGENLMETALREWEEEVGDNRHSLEVLGSFGEFNTFTGYVIVPFIAYYKGNFNFKPNPDEVERMILLDLESFHSEPFYEMENPRNPGKSIYYLRLSNDILWGATAQILVSFLSEFGNFERRGEKVFPNLNKPPFFSPDIYSK
ncbi:MAG: CoA pyrophosphatase [Spirochaetia bacterium]|nr:CoA pyrophosphatase [Spirochaetia bacterium]